MSVAHVTLDKPPANSYDLEFMEDFARQVDAERRRGGPRAA